MTEIREMTDDGLVDMGERNSAIRPYALTHGTMLCKDLKVSREFYEKFLGLQCVQHGTTSFVWRCGMKFHVVCVQLGPDIRPCTIHNHWGLDVGSEDEVNAAHEAALLVKDQYGLKEIRPPAYRHGVYSFYIEDMDSNWWEVQYYGGFQNDDLFDFGDRFTPDGKPIIETAN